MSMVSSMSTWHILRFSTYEKPLYVDWVWSGNRIYIVFSNLCFTNSLTCLRFAVCFQRK